jgi:transposase-like protein
MGGTDRCRGVAGKKKETEGYGRLRGQVPRITIYVVNYKRDECLPIIEKARTTLFGDHKPADVVLGVAKLSPGYLIEADAIAIFD